MASSGSLSASLRLIGQGLIGVISAVAEATPAYVRLYTLALNTQQGVTTLETTFMATAAELQAGIDTLNATVADYTSDVSAKLQTLADQQAAMKVSLDAALANDSVDAATIADLTAQLAAMSAGTDSALAQITALNTAVAAADVAVDQGTPAPAPEA